MQNLTIEQLREMAQQAQAQATAKLAEALEIAQLRATITLNSSDKLLEAKAQAQFQQINNNKILDLIQACKSIVDQVQDRAPNGSLRQWKPNGVGGYGNQIYNLTQLLNGVRYSGQLHRNQMLALTGLSDLEIELALDAFGGTPWFDPASGEILMPVKGDADKINSALMLVQSSLGIVLDKTITQQMVDAVYADRLRKAQVAKLEFEDTNAGGTQALDLS